MVLLFLPQKLLRKVQWRVLRKVLALLMQKLLPQTQKLLPQRLLQRLLSALLLQVLVPVLLTCEPMVAFLKDLNLPAVRMVSSMMTHLQ